MTRLPLATLYLTERCNSRCVTCDYWRTGGVDLSVDAVVRLLPDLKRLDTQWVMLSGGEPLIHPEWASIALLLKSHGLKVGLLTSGVSLAKHARRAVRLFDDITVSLDGIDRQSYAAIRGLDAFEAVCRGIRETAALGASPSVRVTLQRRNYRHLLEFVTLAETLGAAACLFWGSTPRILMRLGGAPALPPIRRCASRIWRFSTG